MINKVFQPELPQPDLRERMLNEMQIYSDCIPQCSEDGMDEAIRAYDKRAAEVYLKYRKECYIYFLRNIYRYSFSTIAFSGFRFIRRRLGFG